jgi:hypothetical protein
MLGRERWGEIAPLIEADKIECSAQIDAALRRLGAEPAGLRGVQARHARDVRAGASPVTWSPATSSPRCEGGETEGVAPRGDEARRGGDAQPGVRPDCWDSSSEEHSRSGSRRGPPACETSRTRERRERIRGIPARPRRVSREGGVGIPGSVVEEHHVFLDGLAADVQLIGGEVWIGEADRQAAQNRELRRDR